MKKYSKKELIDLVDVFAFNKAELDNKKAYCDKLNKDLKKIMTDLDTDTIDGTDVTAKLVIQNRESVNEDKMLEILRANWSEKNGSMQCPYIKTKFVIDMDELERAIYKGELSADVLSQLDTCKTITPVQTLRLNTRRV